MPDHYEQCLGPSDGNVEALGVAPGADTGDVWLDAADQGAQHTPAGAVLWVCWGGKRQRGWPHQH